MSDTAERQWSTEEQRWLYPEDIEIRRLRAALEAARRPHYVCEDCWYSCPKSGYCCNDETPPNKCNCGADEHNAKIDEALKDV